MEIGFIGVGDMGGAIASRLIAQGHDLSIYARRPETVLPFVELGAVARRSPAALAESCDVICTCLPGPDSLKEVVMGPAGLLEGVQKGQRLIAFETNSPAAVRELAAALDERGADMLDAPVSGGAPAANAGALAIWIGGSADAVSSMMPIFEDIGDKVRHMGPLGTGCTAKLLHQMVLHAAFEAIGEARDIAVAAGLSPTDVAAVLQEGAFAQTMLSPALFPRLFQEPFSWAKFQSDIPRKDQALALELAQLSGTRARLAEWIEQQMASEGLKRSC